eukprot:399185_1
MTSYITKSRDYWNGFSMSNKICMMTASLGLFYCTLKIYTNRREIAETMLLSLPQNIKYMMLNTTINVGMTLNADIYPNALWIMYRIKEDKMEKIKQLLPCDLTLRKHKIFGSDKNKDYYLCYNIYMSMMNDVEALRLEINVIVTNKDNKPCWVTIDYFTDGMRFDSIAPFAPSNCNKKYFHTMDSDDDNMKSISAGIDIDIQEKKHTLFDVKGKFSLNGEPLEPDSEWISANDCMYMGGHDRDKLDKYRMRLTATFDRKEHGNYLKIKEVDIVNNLFTGIRGEYVTGFVIPNKQNYTITIGQM